MADDIPGRRPLLNPVLKFTKDPRPAGITARGKNADGIKQERLAEQRQFLSKRFKTLAKEASKKPRFGGQAIFYASMFDDSLATTWTPTDLFHHTRGARLIAPYGGGYLVEIDTSKLDWFSALVVSADAARDKVDISRIKTIRFYEPEDAISATSLDDLWEQAPETDGGKVFLIWLMPFKNNAAAEHLLQEISSLRERVLTPLPPLLSTLQIGDSGGIPVSMRRGLRTAATAGDRLNLAMRDYRTTRRAKATVVVRSRKALDQLVGSGAVFRMEAVSPIAATSPGEGKEPDRPLPSDMTAHPIVGVVDGGLTAASYQAAEAWRVPPFVRDRAADSKHGNQVSSLVVQGHDWNNNLTLPQLYCQIGTVQAVPKQGSTASLDPQDFIKYLDIVMASHPETKVWNMSFNQRVDCDMDAVSDLGHEIALLARKHGVLPIISIGNKPGNHIQPPGDCEAAITIGGRVHTDDGDHGDSCPVSQCGPGPSSMLKPEISHHSKVRAIGGVVIQGSSFATALTSPLAAHTAHRLREPTPDAVKAMLLHNAVGDGFDTAIGFGSPDGVTLPWECKPGFVTLQWSAKLRPGAAYYWELPIPPSMRDGNKIRGRGSLTAVLNPHPLVTDYAGPNYFSVRLNAALQVLRGKKAHNLLGSIDTDKIPEEQARTFDHKWSPIRQHNNDFSKRGVSVEGDFMRVYARIYTRDLYLYDYASISETPELDASFVLSIGTGNEEDDVYNEMRDELGAFVETAVIETDIDVENDGE